MRRSPWIFAVVLAIAASSLAADDVLRLRTGNLAVGKIVGADREGVTLQTENGEAKYDWNALTPLCEYEVRADLVDPEDGAGHAALAQLCLAHGLYSYARQELAIAEGVGYAEAEILDELRKAVDQAEADEAFARIEQLMVEEDYERALEEVRKYLVQAPPSDFTTRAKEMVPDLLRRIDMQERRVEEDRKAAEEDRQAARLAARIDKLQAEADAEARKATASFAEAIRYHEIGNVTRARKAYEATEQAVLKAGRALTRLQRAAGRGVASEKAEQDKDALKKRLVEVYLGLARLYVDDRNYKRGVTYVNRVLFLDPVNREALDMRTRIDENRIQPKSFRKLTNTPVRYR